MSHLLHAVAEQRKHDEYKDDPNHSCVVEDREMLRLEAQRVRNEQIQAHVNELKAKYSWAKPNDGNTTPWARAAANLRTDLQQTFPGVQFSVRSKSYSMGNSVSCEWTLGPTGSEVDKIAEKYEYGRFDSMQDLSTNDNSVFGEAVGIVLGRAKHVSTSRVIPDEVYSAIERLLCEAQQVEYTGPQTAHVFGQGDVRFLSDHVREILSNTTFPLHFEIDGLVWKETGYDETTGEDVARTGYHLTFKDSLNICPKCHNEAGEICCEMAGELRGVEGVTVTENPEKNGIEIRFASKPAQSVLDAIHAQGHGVWRWHQKGKFWYAKANDSTRAFAQSLKGGE